MTEFLKPHHLEPGDSVGIVSPSSSIEQFPVRLERGIQALKSLGLQVILAENSLGSFRYSSGTPEQRAGDINNLFADESINAIICSTGGNSANSVLPLLDYGVIKENPKIFCGFSDITCINNAITSKTGLITFSGPTVLPTFGEYGGAFDFSVRNFKKALFTTEPIGAVESSPVSTDESLFWDRDDTRPRELVSVGSPRVLAEGTAEGRLFGGNLQTLSMLVGTEYMPDTEDSILFLEDVSLKPDVVERYLSLLAQANILNKINGLVFARMYKVSSPDNQAMIDEMLCEIGKKFSIPVICDVDAGHTNPIVTLPIGAKARVNTKENLFEILESATT